MLAGLVFLAAACEKNIAIENSADDSAKKIITETVSADVYGETKATVSSDDGGFAWLKYKDKIAVHVNGTTPQYVNSGTPNTSYTTAAFSVSYPAGYARDAFAIFPNTLVAADAANYGQSGHSLDVTLPSSYTLEQVSGTGSGMLQYETAANIKAKAGTVTPCPMIATNNSGEGWMFYQLCGMLRLTVNSIPSDATGLVIQFPGKKVNGSFSIASPVMPGTSTIETGVPASGEDQITVTFDAGTTSATINLPLPTGDYDDVFITPVGSGTKVAAVRHINAGGYTAQAAHGKKLTTALVAYVGEGDEHYVFAPGNLQYIGSAATPYWKFANYQYTFFKNVTGQASAAANVDRDYFGWGTSGYDNTANDAYAVNFQPYATSKDEVNATYNLRGYGPSINQSSPNLTGTSANYDWGVFNNIGPYSKGVWHTPTKEDWASFGTISHVGRAVIQVSGDDTSGYPGYSHVNGIVLIPAIGWTDPATTTRNAVPNQTFTNSSEGDASTTWDGSDFRPENIVNYYTWADWQAMENAGAVFLPATGMRGWSGDKIVVGSENGGGSYWASTVYSTNPEEKAYIVEFNASHTDMNEWNRRGAGLAVRLIRKL